MTERGKGFPRLSLASAVKVIDVASKFGKSWPKKQFAGFSSQSGAGSAKSGAFAARVASLKDFGLIEVEKDTVILTDLGTQIAKPVTDEERAMAITKAFMNVEVFKKLFESLDQDEELSLDQVAQFAVFNLGISRESKDKYLSVFIESGRFVNLVSQNKERSTITLSCPKLSENADSEPVKVAADSMERGIGLAANTLSIPTNAAATSAHTESTKLPLTEQGVNYSGDGWSLTVLLKTEKRLSAEVRKKVRDLIEAAEVLSDELHDLEEVS